MGAWPIDEVDGAFVVIFRVPELSGSLRERTIGGKSTRVVVWRDQARLTSKVSARADGGAAEPAVAPDRVRKPRYAWQRTPRENGHAFLPAHRHEPRSRPRR